MRIVYQVTDEDIRANVEDALTEIESDTTVIYPEESTRNEVIDICTEYIVDAYERNACCECGYVPHYYETVWATLLDYDCLKES